MTDISQFEYPTERPSPRLWICWGDDSTPSTSSTEVVANDSLDGGTPLDGHVDRRAGDYVIHGAFVWHGRVLARFEQAAHVNQNSSTGLTLYAVAGNRSATLFWGLSAERWTTRSRSGVIHRPFRNRCSAAGATILQSRSSR